MPDCKCESCTEACRRYPGWFDVAGASAALEAGLGQRLMADWWVGIDGDVYVLMPATSGYEGKEAPETIVAVSGMPCTFLTDDGLCSLHDGPHKPAQCRSTMVCRDEGQDKKDMWLEWDTDAGRAVIEKWRRINADG